ncbi:MAG: hypothetical protein LH629_07170 [Ignavibacteria bacterium]|nr:hypothetical protein [Ignavibacteria bacterium]
MNYFDKNKIIGISVVLLILINLILLSYIWKERGNGNNADINRMPPDRSQKNERMKRAPENGPKEFIIKELSLSDSQIKEYGKLVDEHRANMRNINDELRDSRQKLWNAFSKSENDTTVVLKMASDIGEIEKQKELITYGHFQKVRNLCDEAQKKKFDDIIEEVIKMMSPKPSPGR